MRETYYASFDPASSDWHASALTHEYPGHCWVFRICGARSAADAISKAAQQLVLLKAPLSSIEHKALQRLVQQVQQLHRHSDETLIVQIADADTAVISGLSLRGYFSMANSDEVLLHLGSAGVEGYPKPCYPEIRPTFPADGTCLLTLGCPTRIDI